MTDFPRCANCGRTLPRGWVLRRCVRCLAGQRPTHANAVYLLVTVTGAVITFSLALAGVLE